MRRLVFVFGPAFTLLFVLVPTAGRAGPPEASPAPEASPPADPGPPADSGTSGQIGPVEGLQVQGPGAQIQGPGTQSQQAPVAPPPGPGAAPNIQVNPQIQVQVQPTIETKAEPKADAKADADADADADAKPQADAGAEVSTELETKAEHAARVTPGSTTVVTPAPATSSTAPVPGVAGQRRIRVVMRPTGHHHDHDHGRPVRIRGRGLLTAGIVSFGAGYATAAINGGWLHGQCEDDDCRRLSRELFVPVAGPFLAMQHVEERDTQIKLGVMGGAQSLGVLLGLVGASVAIHDARERRRIEAEGIRVAEGIHVAPHAGVGGAGLTLRAGF